MNHLAARIEDDAVIRANAQLAGVDAGEVHGIHHVLLDHEAAPAALQSMGGALENIDAPACGPQGVGREQAGKRAAHDDGARCVWCFHVAGQVEG